jgi:hypothetical protein
VPEINLRDDSCIDMTRISNKSFILLFIVLFAISTAILLIASVASTSSTPVSAWGGYLDVGIVFLIALTGFVIYQRNKSTPRYDISHFVGIYLFPLILVGMWVSRDSLDFNILLPGVAWRTYFFLSILPHALTLWKSGSFQ